MPNAKDLKGKPIYSVADGRQLGEIKDIYLDAGASKLVAVLIGTEGFFARKPQVLRREAVRTLGVDAWLAHEDAEVELLEEVEGFESLLLVSDLRKREIETMGQTKIGTVADVILDSTDVVRGFALAKVHVQGPVAEAKTVALEALVTLGDSKTAMIVDLEKAEQAAQRGE